LLKKVISAKVYDTETARYVGEGLTRGRSGEDKDGSRKLYQKKTGEFFLCTSKPEYPEGCQIRPMSSEEAYDWALRHLDEESFENYFGKRPEDDERFAVEIYLDPDLEKAVRTAAAREELDISECIDRALRSVFLPGTETET